MIDIDIAVYLPVSSRVPVYIMTLPNSVARQRRRRSATVRSVEITLPALRFQRHAPERVIVAGSYLRPQAGLRSGGASTAAPAAGRPRSQSPRTAGRVFDRVQPRPADERGLPRTAFRLFAISRRATLQSPQDLSNLKVIAIHFLGGTTPARLRVWLAGGRPTLTPALPRSTPTSRSILSRSEIR